MLFVLLLLPILVVSSNPFHKYPYVFLLDVGNEELEKVDTEQIRLSAPGGSVALRYPAVGNGDDIAHVRVSGIDFGTDLKANIVDGGPGYKYVVIVLMGNPGVAFDAVITIQTVPNVNNDSIQYLGDNFSNDKTISEESENNSAEDFSDGEESVNASQDGRKGNEELTQDSSNVYEALSGYGSDDNTNENDDESDEDTSSSVGQTNDYGSHNENAVQDNSENIEVDYDDSNGNSGINLPVAESSSTNDGYSQYQNNQRELYETWKSQNVYNGEEDPQLRDAADQNYVDREDLYESNADYEEKVPGKYRDANNNDFINTDDSSAVDY